MFSHNECCHSCHTYLSLLRSKYGWCLFWGSSVNCRSNIDCTTVLRQPFIESQWLHCLSGSMEILSDLKCWHMTKANHFADVLKNIWCMKLFHSNANISCGQCKHQVSWKVTVFTGYITLIVLQHCCYHWLLLLSLTTAAQNEENYYSLSSWHQNTVIGSNNLEDINFEAPHHPLILFKSSPVHWCQLLTKQILMILAV